MSKAHIYDMTAEPVHLKGVVGRQWRVNMKINGVTWQHYDWDAHVTHIPFDEDNDPMVVFASAVTVLTVPDRIELELLATPLETAIEPGDYFWDLMYTGKVGSPQQGIGPLSLIGGPCTAEEGPTQ